MTTQEHLCKVCPAYGQEPIHFEYEWACNSCRARMRRHLADITEQWLQLDPMPAGGNSERISGSKEAPLGARVDVLDQQLPVGPSIWLSEQPIRANIGDQVGSAPAVVVLDAIATEWLEVRRARGLREHRPVPTVADLCSWLAFRVDWACDRLPDAIGSNALELKGLVGRLYTLNGNTRTHDPEPVPATPCGKCGQIALVRVDGQVLCTNCSQYSGPFADLLAVEIARVTTQEQAA